MKIYNYDHNGEYTGEGLADPDPMEGLNEETGEPNVWLIPANATLTPPPASMTGNARVFRDGKWGYVKVSEGPDGGHNEEPHAPDANDVVNARELRLQTGFQFDFGDERGVHDIGTSKQDMEGWDEVTKLANALIMSGQPDTIIGIMTNTGPVQVTALEWQSVLVRAGEVRQPIFAASFILQNMNPIPSDYMDHKYWPAPLPLPVKEYNLEDAPELEQAPVIPGKDL